MASIIITTKVSPIELNTILDALELYRVHMLNLARSDDVEKIKATIPVRGGDPRRCSLLAVQIAKEFGGGR